MGASGLRRDDERDLAFGRMFYEMSRQLGGGGAAVFLEGFCEFPSHADEALGTDGFEGC